jgi:hypothetical protein
VALVAGDLLDGVPADFVYDLANTQWVLQNPQSLSISATNITTGTLADARLSSNVPLLNASNTFSGGLTRFSATTANRIIIRNDSAPTDSKAWSVFIEPTTGDLSIRSRADDSETSGGSIPLTLRRGGAGTDITEITLSATLMDFNGDVDISGTLTGGGLGSLAALNTINNANWSGTDLAVTNGGTGASSASAARTALGLVIGTDVAADNAVVKLTGNQTVAGNKTFTGTTLVSTLPRSTGASPAGGTVYARTADTTIPTAATGDVYSVYNNSASAITLTQGSGLTLRLAGTATTGSRTLAPRGLATIWFNAADDAVCTGAGVS